MDTSTRKRNNSVLAFFCAFVLMLVIVETAFMRLVHYDSQNHYLRPEHYNVEVATEEDHRQLSNPEIRKVYLSNGTLLEKGPGWDSHLVPKRYKSANDGSHYVLVTVRGTAPYMDKWYESITPFFILCIIGLFWGLKRKRLKEPQKAEN